MHGNVSEWTMDWFGSAYDALLKSIQPVRFPAPCGLTKGVLWIRWVMAMAYTENLRLDLHQVLTRSCNVGFRLAYKQVSLNLSPSQFAPLLSVKY